MVGKSESVQKDTPPPATSHPPTKKARYALNSDYTNQSERRMLWVCIRDALSNIANFRHSQCKSLTVPYF